ncbi:DUF899 domain-containing protein, partial [Erwinia amylovora]|uniref:DUF899 domain-containing protein n=1 Tax=Erwinia amylovora TaxID=552 RepID=UPI0020C0E689
ASDALVVEQMSHYLSALLHAARDTTLVDVSRGFADGLAEYPWVLAVQSRISADLVANLQSLRY